MPITGMVAASASLKVKNLVAERRKIMGDNREDTLNFLTSKNVEFIPSESNCFMMNVKQPGKTFYAAMAAQNVYIGRVWPSMPNWVRVSVGSKDEMAKFKTAFVKAYNA
jgi:histidinol-phosphate aminotransferase